VVPDHPTLAGHFPGHPVLPGVTVLSWVMQALAERPDLAAALGDHPGVAQAKFLNAATPGSRLRVVLKTQGQGVAFEVTSGTVPVARGLLTAGGSGTSSTAIAAAAPSQAAAS
jgi:3-hydroxymyristoyl/3-hydroxydecanoyl-(acyl carrier protein) dehydratase